MQDSCGYCRGLSQRTLQGESQDIWSPSGHCWISGRWKKRAAQVQRELFQPPVFDWGPVSSRWFCCVCPQSHSLQSRIHWERQRWHHSCNALLKITRTKKCFELCDDNYPDLKISRCSTRQGEIRVRQELLGDTWQSSDQARSWLELPAGFPPSDHIYSGTTRTGTLDF